MSRGKGKIGESFKRYTGPTDGWDTIVIGSGIGGLTAASLLARKGGEKVLVLERHYTAGGFTHVFTRPGYEWDVGVHYIGDVHDPKKIVRMAFDYLSEGDLHWQDMGEVYDDIVIGDQHFPFPKGRENFAAMLKQRFPGEESAIDEYLRLTRQAVKAGRNYFAEKAIPALPAKFVGGKMRAPMLQLASQTTYEVLSKLTRNELLIAVLTGQYGDYGLPPKQSSFAMHATLAEHYFGGGGYPVGGAARMAETIVDGIEQRGGKVLISADVKEILIDGRKAIGVKMADGREFHAKKIVSDAGVFNTYDHLMPQKWRQKIDVHNKIKGVQRSLGHLGLYVGFKHTDAEMNFPSYNYWVYPSADHDANMARFLADPMNPFAVSYISFPSAKDPDWKNRYPGTSTVQVVTGVPYDWFKKWEDAPWKKRGQEYEAFKAQFAQRMLEELYKQAPQARGKVDFVELSTPLSTKTFANYDKGEIYGLDHAPSRFKDKFIRIHAPVKNLYLTGQDICTAGVAGAMMGGIITSMVLLRNTNLIAEMWQERDKGFAKAG